MKPTSVEIVKARAAGIIGYVNLGRGTLYGNPFTVVRDLSKLSATPNGVRTHKEAVDNFLILWNRPDWGDGTKNAVAKLLERDTPDGVLRIGCPCNGTFKGHPCHTTVIKEYLEQLIAQKEASHG